MTDEQGQYELTYRFGDVSIELNASGLGGGRWARIVHAIHSELSKPDYIITLPDKIDPEEAERIRAEWTRRNPVRSA